MTEVIDGHKIAEAILTGLKLPQKKPGLAILVFKDDRAGQVYAQLKTEAAAKLGIKVIKSSDEADLDLWDKNKQINGIIIQYPGWRGKDYQSYWDGLVQKIPPQKDVDGLRDDSPFTPATVRAIEKLLGPVDQKKILIVGQGMVARAAAKKFIAKHISSHDPGLDKLCLEADVVITACGRPGLIKTVKPGATVIDCGWPKGDVDFAAVKNIAGAITPVPGGVGPVTVACLLENLLLTV